MDYAVVCTVALLAAALTLFSGFGLGTLLMPAFALFFPLDLAVAATALVHLANNLFKLALVGRSAIPRVVALFALPAVVGAIAGALLLVWASRLPRVASYHTGTHACDITVVKLVVAVLIIAFALLELLPRFERLAFPARLAPLGGLLSGFFGGLSGHQGALRSAFLVRLGLGKEAFIGTGVVTAVMVDLARLSIYASTETSRWRSLRDSGLDRLIIAAALAAFVGSFAGSRLVKKVTMRTLRTLVGVMLVLMGAALAAGLV